MTTLVRLAKRRRGQQRRRLPALRRTTPADWSSAVPYGLRRATQALTLAAAYRRGEPACDVIDELAFDDEASAVRCLADPAFAAVWASPLLDPASIACLVVEEHVAKPGPVPASFVKNYELVTKRPGMDRDEFDRLLGAGARAAGGDDPDDQALRAGPPVARHPGNGHGALRRPRHHLVRRRRRDAGGRRDRGLR